MSASSVVKSWRHIRSNDFCVLLGSLRSEGTFTQFSNFKRNRIEFETSRITKFEGNDVS